MRHILITIITILLFTFFLFSCEQKEQGNFTFPNGTKYKGELKDGKPNGQGTSTFTDGGKYVGKWREDKPWNVKFYDKKGNTLIKIANGVLQR